MAFRRLIEARIEELEETNNSDQRKHWLRLRNLFINQQSQGLEDPECLPEIRPFQPGTRREQELIHLLQKNPDSFTPTKELAKGLNLDLMSTWVLISRAKRDGFRIGGVRGKGYKLRRE